MKKKIKEIVTTLRLEIWENGKPRPAAIIVAVQETEPDEYPIAWPGPTLDTLDAVLLFVKEQFPDGWEIVDGKVQALPAGTVAKVTATKEEEEDDRL